MNRLEFRNVVNAVLTSNSVLSSNDNYYIDIDERYCFNALDICFSGSYYAIVKGRIPLTIVNELYNDDTIDTSGIRFGEFGNGIPNDYAIDDIYKRDVKDIVDNFGDAISGLEKYEKAKYRLLLRKEKRKYVELLYIEDKEVLLLLLIKMRNYYNKKEGF